MVTKWVRAVFMCLLGTVLLLYSGGFVDEMREQSSQQWNMSLDWTWDLIIYLIMIIVAWLFVYAALTVVTSLTADAYTLKDVMDRLERIEKRLPADKTKSGHRGKADDPGQAATVEHDGVPPPPRD